MALGPAEMVQVVGLSKVYDPGCHCAFTDIVHWRGRMWLAFRQALNHSVHPSGQIVVMSSANHGFSFEVVARIGRRGMDVRDPHFFVVDDRLHLVIPGWVLPHERMERVTIVARSDDGLRWERFDEIGAFSGRTVWRPRRGPDGSYYAAAYGPKSGTGGGVRVLLLRTADGLDWREVSVIHDEDYPNETELCFLPDGNLLALVRREKKSCRPLLARSKPPYTEWEKTDCDQFLQGPLMEHLGGGRILVVGRSPRTIGQKEKFPVVTRLFSLDAETARLEPGAALESGGDTSYAGFAMLPDGASLTHNALLSYYSGHGFDNGFYLGGEQPQRCAVYVARLLVSGLEKEA